MAIMTHDNEWSHEELYGVAYDECMRACRNVGFLLDTPHMNNPSVLIDVLMDELDEGKNLVDYYDEMYAEIKSSDDTFAKWDEWIINRIQSTLQAHKYKHYVR